MTMEPEFATDTINDRDFEELLLPELREVGKARPEVAKLHGAVMKKSGGKKQPYAIGLALSGGGIRSATVSLGVMQKLAKAGILKHVDYLSTVSGGGYIGSALTWWLRAGRTASVPYDTGANFPFSTDDPREPETPLSKLDPADPDSPFVPPMTPLQYLRVQGNYLTPSGDLSVWSATAIVLRAVLLNLLVWIPVAALIAYLLLWLGQYPLVNGLPYLVNMSAPDLLTMAAAATGSLGNADVTATIPPLFLLMLILAGAIFILFLLGSFNHSLLSWTNRTEADRLQERAGVPSWKSPYRWAKAGALGALGLAILAVMTIWLLMGVGAYVFAPETVSTTSFYSPIRGFWVDTGILAATIVATFLLNFILGQVQWVSGRNYDQVWTAVAALAALVAVDWVLQFGINGDGTAEWPKRAAAVVQFIFGIGFLAYANYVVGLLIRHALRDESVIKREVSNAFFLEYQARRLFEIFFGNALRWSAVLVAIGVVPLISAYIDFKLGGVWAALGLAFTLAGQVRARTAGQGRLTNILLIVGAALFAYGVVLIGYRLALVFEAGDVTTKALIAALTLTALISGWFVNTNHVGLHRFYRDRLMEAFMPDDETLANDSNEAAGKANQFFITDAWPGSRPAEQPYHIVNTNLVLSNSKQRKFRLRGGDNFILSPLFIGSSATGWQRTGKSESADMTLASAMAISGAAANPRGGAGGRGLTRNPSVAIAMSLLNIRLGYWARNPRLSLGGKGSRRMSRPNHFWPGGAYALSRTGYREDNAWLELADGGHFENLAVYELIRRRCGLIIICDGGQDNASSYADLVTAVQRAGQDFGATVRFEVSVNEGIGSDRSEETRLMGARWQLSSPARLIAKSGNTDYPKGAEFAEKGYFVASIDYGLRRGGHGWPRRGTLIYLKSTLIRDLAIAAKGYRGAHAEFPQQTTGDQFFDEEQFEAYREVGYRICAQMIDDLGLDRLFANERPDLETLRRNARFQAA